MTTQIRQAAWDALRAERNALESQVYELQHKVETGDLVTVPREPLMHILRGILRLETLEPYQEQTYAFQLFKIVKNAR